MKQTIIYSAMLALANVSVSAMAADESEVKENTIVIKSQWREQTAQNTTGSLAVIHQEDIQQRDAQHVEDLLNRLANINFNTGASRGRFVQIRGIGERSQFQDPINPSVGFFIDGIDFSGTLGGATLYDATQLEVLRGPQGARFGASALAGAMYLTTEAADSERSRFDLMLAEYNTSAVGIATSGSINERSALRVALHQLNSDGFTDNSFLNRDDTQNRDELTARLKYQYRASEQLTFDWAWHHIDVDNGYDAFSLDNTRTTRSDQPGFDRQATDAMSLSTYFSGLNKVDMQLHVAIADSDLDYGYDEDWTFVGFHPDEYSSFDRYLRERQTGYIDWRWLSRDRQELLGGSTNWVFGAYYKREDEQLLRQYTYLAEDFTSEYATYTRALYGEVNTEYSEHWSTDLGVRVEKRTTDYRDSTLVRETRDTMVGGKWALNYAWNPQTQSYFMVARGFKAGGVNPQVQLDPELRQFDAEKNWNLEIGYKQQLATGFLRIAAFVMERDDQHTKQWQIYTRPDNTQGFIGYVGNVDNGKNRGVELEWHWRALPEFQLDVALGLLEAELAVINRDGNTQVFNRDAAQAPSYNYSVNARWLPNENWSSQITFEGKDDYFFSDTHDERSLPTDLIHWRLTYTQKDWSLALWVHNLTDETYYTRGFGGFGNDPRDGYTAKPYYQFGDPRQSGVTFQYNY
ncbi:TonB-dependent receptor [Pleionea litopenaei]|uniref:TonB-dependent receptor n=1 Tax=Pleionea litopenaei TaxID=3070815 RepID=A0AA51RQ55_9GAMM|nr:TonB-dependent receptor [Pleionea sp. HL-JVS1]WMS85587.1 TonB-dependent receptor [Pleionea sp. HL-JVS1]